MKKAFLSTVLTLCIILSSITVSGFTVFAVANDTESSSASVSTETTSANAYGLVDNVQDGVILHAWNWSFNNIKAQMKTIAECGYTSIQTSPIQIAKEDTKGVSVGNWWVFYQPAGFSIDNTGSNALGNKAEFTAMCAEAHKYGIHIIVDVVANHLGNKSNWQNLCQRAYQYEPQIANNWLFHNEGSCHDGSAWNVTRGQIGMPDLQTENSVVQQRVLSFLKECIDCGADGFRFDAAKHIETPDDGSIASQFWPTVINGAKSYYANKGTYSSLYNYGEILNTCGGGRSYGSYAKYMSVTDNTTGNSIRGSVAGGNASGAAKSNYNTGLSPDKVVLWAESHDTYSNDSRESTSVSDSNINKTWALVGSRNKASALYFARSRGYKTGTLGNIESSQWKSTEVAEVNKFHNYFNGQSEYLASSGSIAYNERGTEGVVLVNCSGGSTSVSVKANKMKDGTYKDQVSGNTFTVSGGQIKGQIGSTGIAVVYNAVSTPIASVNPGSKSYKTDSLELKLEYANATSGQYSIDGGEYKSFTNGQTITIGAGLPYGTKTTVSVKASDGSATSEVASYTYTKVDPSLTQKVYFDNKAYNWSSVYCYIYDGSGSGGSSGGGGNSGGGNTDIGGGGSGGGSDTPVTPSGTIQFTDNQGWGDNIYAYFWSDNQIDLGGAWPGTKMGNPTNNGLGQNNYSCSIPSGATYVIFTNGSDQTVDISLSSYDGYYTDGTRDSSGHLNAYGWNSTGLLSVGSSKDILSVGDDGVDTTPCNAPWPGQKMTLDSSTGYYIIDVPEGFENGCVIFTEGATATTNRYPADMEPGLELGGSTKLFSANHSWTDYTPVTTTTKATTTTTATTSTTTTTTTPVKTYYYGDVNLDGVITVRDATALQKYCASQSTLIAIQKQASDVNADGAIDVRDVSAIQKYLLSFIKSFPAGTTFTA